VRGQLAFVIRIYSSSIHSKAEHRWNKVMGSGWKDDYPELNWWTSDPDPCTVEVRTWGVLSDVLYLWQSGGVAAMAKRVGE